MDDAGRHDSRRDVSGVSPCPFCHPAALPPRPRSPSGLDLRIGDEDGPVDARLCDWISTGAPHPCVLRTALFRALASIFLVLADSGRSCHGRVGWRRVLPPVLDRGRVASPTPSGGGKRPSGTDGTTPVQPHDRLVKPRRLEAWKAGRLGGLKGPLRPRLRPLWLRPREAGWSGR